MNRDAARLATAIEVTTRAAVRLRSSLDQDGAILVRAVATEEGDLDRERLLVLDAFVQRFQQMHEHMTHRFYPALFRAEELGGRPPPMLHLLKWLAEFGLIDEPRVWGRYAEARNRLVHEYPLDAADRAAALNSALTYSLAMLADLDRALAHVNTRGLLEDDL